MSSVGGEGGPELGGVIFNLGFRYGENEGTEPG